MPEKKINIRGLCQWLPAQGAAVAADVLEETLDTIYRQGWADGREVHMQLEVRSRMQTLYEANFYVVPSPEDQATMRAYECLLELLPAIIKDYGGALPPPGDRGRGELAP